MNTEVKKCWQTCTSEACRIGAACKHTKPTRHEDLPIEMVVPSWEEWLSKLLIGFRAFEVCVFMGLVGVFAWGWIKWS